MKLNNTMFNVMQKLLLEAELKNMFNQLGEGDFIYITKTDGVTHSYRIVDDIGGLSRAYVIQDTESKKPYILDKLALEGDDLSLFGYDPDSEETGYVDTDSEITMEVDKILVVDGTTGAKTFVDIESTDTKRKRKEGQARLPQFKEKLDDLSVGDILKIRTESVVEGGDTIVNDLLFNVVQVTDNWLMIMLTDVEGDVEGTKSKEAKTLFKAMFKKPLYVNKDDAFKIIDDSLSLITLLKGKEKTVVPIEGVIDIDVEDVESVRGDEDEPSEEEFIKWLERPENRKYSDLINKTPSFWGKVRGASPKGLLQLKNLMQKSGVKSSYLTKDTRVTFKLVSNDIRADYNHKLVNDAGKTYEAKVVSNDGKLRYGHLNGPHWYINLINETEENNEYVAKVTFCKSRGECTVQTKKAQIRIVKN